MTLVIVPIKLRAAKLFVEQFHRHHLPPAGHICSLAVSFDSKIVGVAIIGRPISRHLDNGYTAEVTRLCTDGTKNACSKLYGAAWKVVRGLGFKTLVTYTLASEPGTSLKASGWTDCGETKGGSWNSPSRKRTGSNPTCPKRKFCKTTIEE